MDHGELLKILLHELQDGVIVCDPDARIVTFSRAAEDMFGWSQAFGMGKSLYNLCFQAPVEYALSLLQYQSDLKSKSATVPYVQFMNASIGQDRYFRCRLSMLPHLSNNKKSFMIIFEDISAWFSPNYPLFLKMEEFRAPLANLRAAVENLTVYPEMSPVMRSAFENVLVQESINLTEAFDALAGSCRNLMRSQDHLNELQTEELFGYVKQYLDNNRNISVTTAPKQGVRVRIDIYGLLVVLDFLLQKIVKKQKQAEIACAIHSGEQFVYIDFIWQGESIATGAVKTMLEEIPENSIGGMTVASILHSMDGDIWSLQSQNSHSTLRFALPVATGSEKEGQA